VVLDAGGALRGEFGRRFVSAKGTGVRRLQMPGQELVDPGDGMIGDARDHVAQKRFGIVAVELGAAQQAVDRRSSLTADITAGEQVVLAPRATHRNARSAALLSISMRPSPQ
jgi:hypothetical protein